MTEVSTRQNWLEFLHLRSQAEMRLFCFPYAGGGAQLFHDWPDALPATVEVCSIHLPGRGRRLLESPFTDMRPLIQAIGRALLPYLDKPFAFFGHSMGALISFEVIRHLRKEGGVHPEYYFVSGHSAPQISGLHPPVNALPDSDFINKLKRLNGTPDELLSNPVLMKLILPTLRADFALCETYTYVGEPPLSCPIIAFGGLQDPVVRPDHLRAWREQSGGTFALRMLPGDHFFMHTSQPLLLQLISQALEKCARRS